MVSPPQPTMGLGSVVDNPQRSPDRKRILAYFQGHRTLFFSYRAYADTLSSSSVLCHIWEGERPRFGGNCSCLNIEPRLVIALTSTTCCFMGIVSVTGRTGRLANAAKLTAALLIELNVNLSHISYMVS